MRKLNLKKAILKKWIIKKLIKKKHEYLKYELNMSTNQKFLVFKTRNLKNLVEKN